MKNKKLLRSIGQIDEDLTLEADCTRFVPHKRNFFLKLAACLVLICSLGAVIAIPRLLPTKQSESLTSQMQTVMPPQQDIPLSQEEPSIDTGMVDFIFGDLALDMTQEQVRAALGEPEQIWNKESLCWVYPTLMLRFHSFDDTVSQISTMAGCEIMLPNGIGLGSPEEYVKDAFPDAYVDPNYNENNADTCYEVYSGSKTLLIGTADGEVVYMSLTCHEDPMLKALTAPEITIYTPVDAGPSWESVIVSGKEAKGICTVLTISEPEEASVEKSEITYWLDFGNGTALCLYGNDCASIYSYSGEALDPSKTDGLTWRLNGRFLDLDNYVIRAIISSR